MSKVKLGENNLVRSRKIILLQVFCGDILGVSVKEVNFFFFFSFFSHNGCLRWRVIVLIRIIGRVFSTSEYYVIISSPYQYTLKIYS